MARRLNRKKVVMQTITLNVIGTTPLLMNNPVTINPLLPVTKAIKELTSKKRKTDADQEEIFRLKYSAALYRDESGPYVPSTWLWKSGLEGARKTKQGKEWEAGVQVRAVRMPLEYVGPRDVNGLYADSDFVDVRNGRIGTSRVPVVRPTFPHWQFEATFDIDDDIMNPRDALTAIHTAGRRIGLGTYRQQFGRFRLEVVSASVNLSPLCDQLDIPILGKKVKAA
jgi:hypothetical protein